jgi:hypothetical protein
MSHMGVDPKRQNTAELLRVSSSARASSRRRGLAIHSAVQITLEENFVAATRGVPEAARPAIGGGAGDGGDLRFVLVFAVVRP